MECEQKEDAGAGEAKNSGQSDSLTGMIRISRLFPTVAGDDHVTVL